MLQGGPSDWLDLVRQTDGMTELALTTVGQFWYLAAGSLGLSMVGIWFLVDRTRALGAPGVSTAGMSPPEVGGQAGRDRRFTVVFFLAAAGMVFATSVLFFAQNQFRADHRVYGRHNDSFTPLWVGAGVIALIGAPGLRRRLMWLAGSAGAIGVSGLVVWANRDPAEMENQFSIFAWTGYGTIAGTASFRDYLTANWSTPGELERLGVTSLAVEGYTARSLPTLLYPFALPGVDVTMYDAQRTEPTGPYVLARVDDPERRAAGDHLVLVDNNLLFGSWDAPDGIGVWVRPGPDQDRLAAAGLLLPDGFPTELPPEARSVSLTVTDGLDGDGTLRLAGGSDTQLTVSGRYTGTESPWPDSASAGIGRVQVLARVEPTDPDLPAGIGSGGELDRWVRPDQAFTSQVTVRAIGPLFADLAPGRYTVHLGVGQAGADGPAWFAPGGPDAAFPLVVT